MERAGVVERRGEARKARVRRSATRKKLYSTVVRFLNRCSGFKCIRVGEKMYTCHASARSRGSRRETIFRRRDCRGALRSVRADASSRSLTLQRHVALTSALPSTCAARFQDDPASRGARCAVRRPRRRVFLNDGSRLGKGDRLTSALRPPPSRLRLPLGTFEMFAMTSPAVMMPQKLAAPKRTHARVVRCSATPRGAASRSIFFFPSRRLAAKSRRRVRGRRPPTPPISSPARPPRAFASP
eukprot:31214-Pelagococcus_subviridis.AAC.11